MNIHISILLPLLILALTHPSKALCQTTSQLNGLCTACPNGQFLSAGFCLTPITGCLTQISNSLCSQCKTGFTLNGYVCTPGASAVPSASSNLDLYTDDGPDKRYELLDYYFKQKYSTVLRDKISDIGQLITLPTTYGYIYAITYYNPFANASLYRAEALVDYSYNITEYSFAPPGNLTSLLWFIARKVTVSNLGILASALLNKVQQFTSNDYRLFFLDFTGRIEVVDVQRTTNLTSPYRTFTTLTQLYYEINQDTVINYVFSEFPTLQMHQDYTASYYSILDAYGNSIDYFKFIFDNQIVVTVQINGLTFSLYSYSEPDSVIATATAQLGGFLPLLTFTDPIYVGVYNALIANYPFLQYKNVQEVRYQLVAGTNFFITFNALPFSDDEYVALAYQPLSGALVVNSLLKNGVDITSTIMSKPVPAYNYQADANFKALYSYFKQTISGQFGGLLPIYQVIFTANTNGTSTYQVIFNSLENTLLQYSPSLPNPYIILSYSSFGIALPTTTSSSSQAGGNDVSKNKVIQFLIQEKPSLFNYFLIISNFQISPGVFNVDVLTLYGTYFARVVNNGLLYLSAISATSTNLCSDLSASEITANTAVASLNTYLRGNYPAISSYTLQLVQGFMSAGGRVNYRFLYSQGATRYQFLLAYSSAIGKYITTKVTQLSGAGCDPSSVLIGQQCVRSCLSFAF